MSAINRDPRTAMGLELCLEIAPVLDEVMKLQGFESKDDQTVVVAAFMSAFTGYMLQRIGQDNLQMVLSSVVSASKKPRLESVKS